MRSARKNSSDIEPPSLEGVYVTNGKSLFCVVAHTAHGIRLEDCYSNLQTYYDIGDFASLGLRRVGYRRGNAPKAA